ELTMWKHLDVFCDWDKGDGFDTGELSEEMRVRRLTYSHTLFKSPPSESYLHSTWEAFKVSLKVDIDELSYWVKSLKPSSVHDFKPLLVLLQAVVKSLVDKELSFFSGTIAELRRRLEEALSVMDSQEEEIEGLRQVIEDLRKRLQLSNEEGSKLRTATTVRRSIVFSRNKELQAVREQLKMEKDAAAAAAEDGAGRRLQEIEDLKAQLLEK
ncbi:hypothetical protein CYMTET_35406, partial [Cymbomonas tetramitiformis]